MPFSEPAKLEAKRKAHFCCVVCHQPFVEVHHIIPQAAAGTDDLDNAAPLCALCHDHFGGNPDKRKQIREMRDLWYELCQTRFRDSPTLELAEAIEDVKGGQQQQAALLSSSKHLLEGFYTQQSEKVSTALTVEQISANRRYHPT
jgi:HNH endonuclease